MIHLHDDLKDCLEQGKEFDQLMNMEGEMFRDMPREGRRTLRFSCRGKSYFIKIHRGVGWREIFKNLFSLRKPILGARNEWQAIKKLNALAIPTTPLVAYGERGLNPARRESFVLTRDLGKTISLETLCADWATNPPTRKLKRSLIKEIARIARLLHSSGMNHRDFYLCHFLLDQHQETDPLKPLLYLIDLHRVEIRSSVPQRWLVKDLGGLYFSALDAGISSNDVYYFLTEYYQQPLREILNSKAALLNEFRDRAIKNYWIMHKRAPENIMKQVHD